MYAPILAKPQARSGALTFPRPFAMVPRIRVGGIGGDDVADPAQQTARADPQTLRDDQPQDTGQVPLIVDVRLITRRVAA